LIKIDLLKLIWTVKSESDFASQALEMAKSTNDAQLLIQSLRKAYAATPTNLKVKL
jgi:hypothetical protein